VSIDLAIIGGTGLYQLEGFESAESIDADTPFGPTSAPIRCGRLGQITVAFLARHGEGHQHLPHRINYRANVWALHAAGARSVVAVNAVGGIAKNCPPRQLVVPDQIIDYSYDRISSFCDRPGEPVQHVDFTDPYSASLRADLLAAAASCDVSVADGGVYGCTQGPRLETRAEVARMGRDGCAIVGMTGMPEAVLARELELNYACLAAVANWGAGCSEQAEITMDEILAHLEAAYQDAHKVLSALVDSWG